MDFYYKIISFGIKLGIEKEVQGSGIRDDRFFLYNIEELLKY